jgi:1-deoxy-D-xylulose-5-phosphate synthase
MDEQVLERVRKRFAVVVTLEEGVVAGGFGDGVASWLSERGYEGVLRRLGLPDEFVPQGSRDQLLQVLKLDTRGVVQVVMKLIGKPTPIIV